MKISLVLIFSGVFCLYANTGYSQDTRVNVHLEGASLTDVFREIEKQSDFRFFYNQTTVNTGKTVNMDADDTSIANLLGNMFRNTGIKYRMVDNYIVVMQKDDSLGDMLSQAMVIQGIAVSGTVTDETNVTLPGVNVTVKGTTIGVVTDSNGRFTINVPNSTAVLVFSSVGYSTQEIVVENQTNIDVILSEGAQDIEEVVVVGYGTQSRRKTISAVSTISPTKLEDIPSSSVINNLGGRTSGILVTTSGGGPTKKSSISIRGGDRPIVVIDGIVSEWFDFENINPKDIDNISVLKDAAAAAMYGARAGNGILLITTKKGENKDLTINYDYSYSLSQPTILPKKMGSYEKAVLRRQAFKNDGQPDPYTDEIMEKYRTGSDPENYPDVDWQALCLNSFAPEQRHNLSINGGTNKNNYYASFSYYDQGTLYKFSTNWYKAYTIRLNVNNSFDKIGLKTSVGLNGIMNESRMPWSSYGDSYYNTWGHMQNKAPWDLAYFQTGLYSNHGDHPLVEMDPRSGYRIPTTAGVNLVYNAEWSVPNVEGWKIKAAGNYRIESYRFKGWRQDAPQGAMPGSMELKNPAAPRLEENFNNSNNYTMQFLTNYDRTFNDISVSAVFGYEYSYRKRYVISASRINYQLNFDQFVAGPTENMNNGGSEEEWGRAGLVGRLKLDYKSKYLLEASFRHDGSDWFPDGKRWGTFYALSGGWVISDEAFMQTLQDNNILNLFKIKGSYGIVGMDGATTETYGSGDWRRLNRFSYVPGYSMDGRGYVVNGNYAYVFHEGDLVSPDITWYDQASSNIGFEFASLNSALYGGFDYFYMRTTGYLASLSGSMYTDPLGKSLPKIKSEGAFRRDGYEFNVGYKNQVGDLHYDVGVNFTHFQELWENHPNEDISALKNPNRRTTHKTSFLRLGYLNDGYYQNDEDIANSPRFLNSNNLSPGDIKYKDLNGDGFIDSSDQTYIGNNAFPNASYGINLDLSYKGWYLYSLFQGATSRDYYMGDVMRSQWGVVYPFQTDYWTPDNRDAMYPRLTSNPGLNGSNNYADSDFWIVNAGYFRLKSLQIGYDFKSSILKNVKFLSIAKLSLSGTNLFTFSKTMKYYFDPESGGDAGNYNNYDYPVQRVFSVTASIGF